MDTGAVHYGRLRFIHRKRNCSRPRLTSPRPSH